MGISINLDKKLIQEAKSQSKVLSRSVPKQIEHWARIGRIAEDNPDLNYIQIKDMLLGIQDYHEGYVEEYKRGTL